MDIGKKFKTFQELKAEINNYESSNFVKLYRRDSRKLESFKKRCPKRIINKELEYANITYSCIHGGKKFKSKSTGKQINTR